MAPFSVAVSFYEPGKSHGNADCLSRILPQQDSEKTIVAAVKEMVDRDTIKQAQANDPLVAAAMHAVQQGSPLPRLHQNRGKFLISGGVLCQIFQESWQLLKLFFWPGYESAIEQWIKECVKRQQRNLIQKYHWVPLLLRTHSRRYHGT